MPALETQLIINADDRTAAAFASVRENIDSLQKTIAAVDRTGAPALKNTGAFAAPGAALQEHAEALEASSQAFAKEARAIEVATPALMSQAATLVGSMAGAAAAFAALKLAGEGATQAFDQQHETIRMQTAGMTPEEISDANKLAAETVKQYPSIQQSDALALARNARSIVGSYEDAAKLMGDISSLYVVAQGSNVNSSPEQVTGDLEQLLKGIEIKGATQNPQEFRSMMDEIAKGLNAFGDTLKPDDYYQMIKYSRQAGLTLSDDFMVGVAPSIAQAMRGSSAGRAFSDFNRAIVGGHMEHSGYKELLSLGLLKEEDVDRTKTGEIKGLKPGHHIAGAEVAAANPYRWVQEFAVPALAAQGVTDKEEIAEHIGRFLTNQYAAQLGVIFATQKTQNRERPEGRGRRERSQLGQDLHRTGREGSGPGPMECDQERHRGDRARRRACESCA